MFFAPPVLEPDSNNPGVQPRHLHQLLLAQEIAGQHGDWNVQGIMCLIIPSALMSQTQSILTTIMIVNEEVLLRMATIHAY